MLRSSLPSGDTASEACLQTALNWIEECTTNHPKCSPGHSNPMPTRVLDLGIDPECSNIKLHITSEELGRYIALSHCWGESANHAIMTLANMSSWLSDGRALSSLPQTYQDAILTTKCLGIRYIWIDSLCIIKDDESDWRAESAKMADVYQNSFITIAATSAGSNHAGMFAIASPVYATKSTLVEFKGSKRALYYRRSLPNHPEWFGTGPTIRPWENVPLLQRAWAYQERLLAPRVLHFTKEELVFECNTKSSCECGGSQSDLGRPVKVQHTGFTQSRTVPSLGYLGSSYERWKDIINEYSRLSLTFGKDKLPALSGVAKQSRSVNKDTYLAGLWLSDMMEYLVWITVFPLPKPSTWRCPSWSWCAVDSTIGLLPILEEKPTHYSHIHSAICIPLGTDDTAELRSGYLEISGPLVEVKLRRCEEGRSGRRYLYWGTESHLVLHDFQVVINGFVDGDGQVYLDYEPEGREGEFEDLVCLLLASYDEDGSDFYLMLRRVGESGNSRTYERIGLATTPLIRRYEWLKNNTEDTATIFII